MKTVGIVGGIAPESTIEYYRYIIAGYREQIKDGSYPNILINSINMRKMLDFAATNRAALVQYLAGSIEQLGAGGADFAVMASNTPHIVFDEVREKTSLPLISIVECACAAAVKMEMQKLGLFGTKFTMQGGFYSKVFSNKGITIVLPQPEEQEYIHSKYMNELVNAVFLPETREGLLNIAQTMRQRDQIDGIILGGTELPLILRDSTSDVSFLDTTKVHVDAIVKGITC